MTPRATYRVQLGPGFGFAEAAATAPYLAALGVTHVYCSPYLQAAPGSTHGYDVVDPARVNEDLGGSAAHGRFCQALVDNGLGQVLDIVPNHMAIAGGNRWWWDVLEHGRASRYAGHFDIDWDPPGEKRRDKLLLPILADHYGRVLEAGDIHVAFQDGRYTVRYQDWELPVAAPDEGLGPVDELNRDPDALDRLLERQSYRLAWWRTRYEELSYRRFFDVDTLVALRADDDVVFADTHDLVLGWLAGGVLDGVRVDHVDGLRDPAGYCARLRAVAPGAWIVVEKILQPGERLPEDWAVAGTTGYDALNLVGGLFVDPGAEERFTRLYASLCGENRPFAEIAYEAKHQILREGLAADLHRLTRLLVGVCQQHRRHRDHPRAALRDALAELLVCFPVYRTYIGSPGEAVAGTVVTVAARRPDADPELLEFLGALLTGADVGPLEDELRLRFQQLTASLMAKGVEDTALYRYARFVALNEVGGAPDRFGIPVDVFHAECRRLGDRWPRSMTTLSTHDTKRSEDVRARLYALSEMFEPWEAFAGRWVDGEEVDVNTQYFVVQNLVGAWPLPLDRALAFAEKAVREAKQRTSWTDPDPAYESAVRGWLEACYRDPAFVADVGELAAALEPAASANSLAQKLVQLMMPGVPDLYQGCELEDRSLVDPDNRRAVDWEQRRRLVTLPSEELAAVAPKLLVVRTALDLRRRLGDLGGYEPLAVPDKAVGFVRGGRVAVAAPVRGPRVAPEVELPAGDWRDRLPGLPVRLLERVG